MFPLILVVCSALTVCFVLTPLCRDFFGFLGVMDKPDFRRKTHSRPIPRAGGIALATAYFIALVGLLICGWRGLFGIHDPSIRLMVRVLPALATIFLIGLFDDLRGMSPWRKLVGQSVAAVCACSAGIHLAIPTGSSVALTVVADLVSIFWLVLCANAINLIDGLDGLAAGVAAIASTSLLVVALLHHDLGLALVITPLIGALIGFLYYNFNPASIFLGDCGSLLIGFLLGCYGLMSTQHAKTGFAEAAPLIALSFPVVEVALSIVRRFLRKRPLFGSDKNHIHHRIVGLGLSHRNAALVLYAACAFAGTIAVLQTVLPPDLATMTLLLTAAVACAGFYSLRYTEFGVLGAFLLAGEFRRSLCVAIHLREFNESLAAAKTTEECWTVLKHVCRETHFSYVSLRLGKKQFEADLQPNSSNNVARLSIALSHSENATFEHDPSIADPAMMIAPMVERLQKQLLYLDSVPVWNDSSSTPSGPLKASVAAAQLRA